MSRFEEYPWLEKFALSELLGPLIEQPSFVAKRMFGGVAVYLHGRISLVIMEGSDPAWNGLLIPSRPERHAEIQRALPSTVSHSILYSWLYLPLESDAFEDEAQKLIRLLRVDNPLYGVEKSLTKPRKNKKTPAAKKNHKKKPAKKK